MSLLTDERAAVGSKRLGLIQQLFPQGIPRLWCPTLTHFAAQGRFDELRIRRHLRAISPWVRGILVPGSTGEGWEMQDADIRALLSIVVDAAKALDIRILVGVLKTDVAGMLACIDGTLSWLRQRAAAAEADTALRQSNVVGFTVCPPRGAQLTQPAIADGLTAILDRGLPVALYQLPQVTQNEMSLETVQALAARHANFYLFKDTSGRDAVAASGVDLGGVFQVRGAEGDYARWPKAAGGPYDGFLLSTANVFAREFDSVLNLLERGCRAEAAELSDRVGRVVSGAFKIVGGFAVGNPFTNANKALDHVMAYGQAGLDRELPLLYTGTRLPASFIERTAELLAEADLMPREGYLLSSASTPARPASSGSQ